MTMLATLPPLTIGQLVTICSHDEELPGAVVSLAPVSTDRWEVEVEVLASVGVGTSRHVVDDRGREVRMVTRNLALVSTGA